MSRTLITLPALTAAGWERESDLSPISVSGSPRRRFSPPVFHAIPPAGGGGGGGRSHGVRPEYGDTDASAPSIFADAGAVYVAKQAAGSGPSWYRSLQFCQKKTDGTFSTTQVAAAGAAFSAPSLAVLNGNVYIAVQGANNSLMCYSAPLGSAFSAHQVDGSNTTYSAPSVGVLPNGKVVIAVQGPNNLLNYYLGSPSKWPAAQHVTFNRVNQLASSAPSLVPVGEEVFLAVRAANNTPMVYYSYGGIGTAIEWGENLFDSSAIASAPSLAANAGGYTGIAAQTPVQEPNQNNGLVFYWQPGATNWSGGVVEVNNVAVTTSSAPSTSMFSSGVCAIVAADAGSNLYYYRGDPGPPSDWTATRLSAQKATGNAAIILSASVCVDSSNDAAHVVAQASDDSLWYFTSADGMNWSAGTQILAPPLPPPPPRK